MKIILTPKKARLLLSSLALTFGVVVLSVSLLSTSQVKSFGGSSASSKVLYFNEKILPDHLLYPVVAAADRLLLISSPNDKKIQLMISYGHIRLDYAWGLLAKGDEDQALIALTKSQKYFYLAGAKAVEQHNEIDESLIQSVKQALQSSINQTEKILSETDGINKDLANQLNNSNKELLKQLR